MIHLFVVANCYCEWAMQDGVEAEDDEHQAFERMQHAQLTAMDPDSSAFFAARKQVRRKQAAQKSFAQSARKV